MEVHPPEHPVQGWRDVLTHLGIVTLGLLIALSLEAVVEQLHRRHLMHETRANLEEELRLNEKNLHRNIAMYRRIRKEMESNVTILKLQKQHPGTPAGQLPGKLSWTAGWEPFTDAEWKTAYQTSGLALIPQHEVAQFAGRYESAEQANKAWDLAGHHVFFLGSYEHVDADPSHLTPTQIDELLHGCGVELAELEVAGIELKNWADSNEVSLGDFSLQEVITKK